MHEAGMGLSQRDRASASRLQLEAMQALNQTVMALRQALDALSAAGSAAGLMEMLQQLQSLAQQQSGVNDELSQMIQRAQPASRR